MKKIYLFIFGFILILNVNSQNIPMKDLGSPNEFDSIFMNHVRELDTVSMLNWIETVLLEDSIIANSAVLAEIKFDRVFDYTISNRFFLNNLANYSNICDMNCSTINFYFEGDSSFIYLQSVKNFISQLSQNKLLYKAQEYSFFPFVVREIKN